jgi:hypothetical protein
MVVLAVGFEVGGEFVNTTGQQRDLNFRATGVTGGAGIGRNNAGLDVFGNHEVSLTCERSSQKDRLRRVGFKPFSWA